ncbi:MAG TPA: MBL fold metallo-hydrolase [Steroidobacteraceae bacterium]|nr:MBL fold metallo-hydrolase [Steroidobacteraceae bacterium]
MMVYLTIMTPSVAASDPSRPEPKTGDGSAVEVASGVLWLRMPLFDALPWINVWAIADGEGWAIVDTGLRSAATMQAWQAAFSTSLIGKPVTRIIATHMHPDHCGMAGWLAERFNVRLWMSQLEYLSCRLMAADTGHKAPLEGVEFYRSAGWDGLALEAYRERFGAFGEAIYPLPAAYRRLSDGETLRIGAHDWTVVMGNGHSPEHACLHCPSLEVLISGDQVLPRISSNVSVYPTEPDANPLEGWLTSLERIKPRVPDRVLVLPAHNSPFRGLHERIDQLIGGHRRALAKLEARLAAPARAIDVFDCLFSRPIRPELLFMATGESVAHLNYLTAAGKATRARDAQGVWWWKLLDLKEGANLE